MKKNSARIGTISMVIGVVLVFVKFTNLGLLATPWWLVTSPIWGPPAVFIAIMAFVSALIAVRGGTDALAEETFDVGEESLTADQIVKKVLAELKKEKLD